MVKSSVVMKARPWCYQRRQGRRRHQGARPGLGVLGERDVVEHQRAAVNGDHLERTSNVRGLMAWTEKHSGGYRGRYRTPDGQIPTAGSANMKRKALLLAQNEEGEIRKRRWHDPHAGRITLADYFRDHWLPKLSTMHISARGCENGLLHFPPLGTEIVCRLWTAPSLSCRYVSG